MALSTAAKAALCLCPPAAMVGTVATVPAAKRAVHHLTAPHHAKPVRRIATAAARPAAEPASTIADCGPAPGPLPAVPLVTYAAPIPDEPGTGGPATGTGPIAGGGGPSQAPVSFAPGTTAVPPIDTPIPTAPVPEPASWALMILGAGAVGVALRRWRQGGHTVAARGRGIAAGTMASGIGTAAEAGDMAVTSVAAKSTLAGVAGKAMLCACPAAVVAGSVVGVPPVRHAVHAATAPAPAIPAPAIQSIRSIVPCSQPVPIPVSAAAVKGFPDTVATLPARPA